MYCLPQLVWVTTLLCWVQTVSADNSKNTCPVQCQCIAVPQDHATLDAFANVVKCNGTLNSSRDHLPADTVRVSVCNGPVNLTDFRTVIATLADIKSAHLHNVSLTSLSSSSSAVKLWPSNISALAITDSPSLERVPSVNSSTLRSLDLSRNGIVRLTTGSFRLVAASLLELLLSANAITDIESDAFANLTRLQCLDLSRNQLHSISGSGGSNGSVFSHLDSLLHLNLSGNFLQQLTESNFARLRALQQLDLSWNRLASVTPGSLELPHLQRLLLEGNTQLGDSRHDTNPNDHNANTMLVMGNGRRLQTVDVSHTGLRQVPAALTHSIRTLRLAANVITTISCGDLDSYPLLQLLDVSANQLQSVQDDALGRLESLRVLYLTRNRLTTIPRSLPEELKVIHLESNHISRIFVGDLQGLSTLEVLLLNDNNISTVDDGAFSELYSLETLDLSRNPITTLGIISGPRQLRVLHLAHLHVMTAAKETAFPLSVPDYLVSLDLSRSSYLAEQLLADTAALAASRQLQELDLSAAGVTQIRPELLHYLSQLRVLRLAENPLNCTGLEWLARWLRRVDSETVQAVCASPAELRGTLLVDVQQPLEDVTEETARTTTIPSTIAVTTASTGSKRTGATSKRRVVNHDAKAVVSATQQTQTSQRNKFNNNSFWVPLAAVQMSETLGRGHASRKGPGSARSSGNGALQAAATPAPAAINQSEPSRDKWPLNEGSATRTIAAVAATAATTTAISPELAKQLAATRLNKILSKYKSQNDVLKLMSTAVQSAKPAPTAINQKKQPSNPLSMSSASSPSLAPGQDAAAAEPIMMMVAAATAASSSAAEFVGAKDAAEPPSRRATYAHPSMLVIGAVVLLATLSLLVMLMTKRMNARSRRQRAREVGGGAGRDGDQDHDALGTSMTSVTDLW